jgi:hypothetical protein
MTFVLPDGTHSSCCSGQLLGNSFHELGLNNENLSHRSNLLGYVKMIPKERC